IFPTQRIRLLHCNVECRRAPSNKSLRFIITGRKHANKLGASMTERRFALPPKGYERVMLNNLSEPNPRVLTARGGLCAESRRTAAPGLPPAKARYKQSDEGGMLLIPHTTISFFPHTAAIRPYCFQSTG